MNRPNRPQNLSNAFGPSGLEDDLIAAARKHINTRTQLAEDNLSAQPVHQKTRERNE